MGETDDKRTKIRAIIAITIVALSVIGISAAAIASVVTAGPQEKGEVTRLIYSSVLPLFGTWVGTVLAFYFARESLQAATDTSLRLTRGVDGQTPVRQAMIQRAAMKALVLAAGADPNAVKLGDVAKQMAADKVKRLPILDASGVALYVIHESLLTEFAATVGKEPTKLTEKLSDLLAKADLKKSVEAIGVVGEGATLAEARAALRSVDGCNDVFVTKTGDRKEPVLGWLTNTLLAGVA